MSSVQPPSIHGCQERALCLTVAVQGTCWAWGRWRCPLCLRAWAGSQLQRSWQCAPWAPSTAAASSQPWRSRSAVSAICMLYRHLSTAQEVLDCYTLNSWDCTEVVDTAQEAASTVHVCVRIEHFGAASKETDLRHFAKDVISAICQLLASSAGLCLIVAQVPSAKVFDDFGGRAMGTAGRRLVYTTIYAAILLNPVLLHLTSAEALDHSLPEARFHRTFAPIVVACLMAPLAQVTGSLPSVIWPVFFWHYLQSTPHQPSSKLCLEGLLELVMSHQYERSTLRRLLLPLADEHAQWRLNTSRK